MSSFVFTIIGLLLEYKGKKVIITIPETLTDIKELHTKIGNTFNLAHPIHLEYYTREFSTFVELPEMEPVLSGTTIRVVDPMQ